MSATVVALHYPFTHCKMPGNVNFDPLGLSRIDLTYKRLSSPGPRNASDILGDYREAELKHGRLAMLAAVAYPAQEFSQPLLAERFNLPSLLSDGGTSPSLVNGNLDASTVVWLLGLGSGLELSRLMMPTTSAAGDYGWGRVVAPNADAAEIFKMQAGEVWNGRIAMMAVLGYVVREALTKSSVLTL